MCVGGKGKSTDKVRYSNMVIFTERSVGVHVIS
jgi:hypothetical protein